MIRWVIIAVAATICSGCACFEVCPDVPKPPKLEPIPELCWPKLRESDPVDKVLRCYMLDIVQQSKAAKERDKALEAYK